MFWKTPVTMFIMKPTENCSLFLKKNKILNSFQHALSEIRIYSKYVKDTIGIHALHWENFYNI